jgi:hypothetical protein
MFMKAKEGVTEEDYYLAEWTPEERSEVRCSWELLLMLRLFWLAPIINLVVLQA